MRPSFQTLSQIRRRLIGGNCFFSSNKVTTSCINFNSFDSRLGGVWGEDLPVPHGPKPSFFYAAAFNLQTILVQARIIIYAKGSTGRCGLQCQLEILPRNVVFERVFCMSVVYGNADRHVLQPQLIDRVNAALSALLMHPHVLLPQ